MEEILCLPCHYTSLSFPHVAAMKWRCVLHETQMQALGRLAYVSLSLSPWPPSNPCPHSLCCLPSLPTCLSLFSGSPNCHGYSALQVHTLGNPSLVLVTPSTTSKVCSPVKNLCLCYISPFRWFSQRLWLYFLVTSTSPPEKPVTAANLLWDPSWWFP